MHHFPDFVLEISMKFCLEMNSKEGYHELMLDDLFCFKEKIQGSESLTDRGGKVDDVGLEEKTIANDATTEVMTGTEKVVEDKQVHESEKLGKVLEKTQVEGFRCM
ncbi:hypothetical protein ACH5RR_015275 [Cinchona calisaya]|uniref:Uncharacterized protein n=1 Tax=Cinchona calisaya TaxID=153742 RepID=A0ABD2ZSP2_9GENT